MKQIIQKSWAALSKAEQKRLRGLMAGNILISMADIAALALLVLVIGFYTGAVTNEKLWLLPDWLKENGSLSLVSLFFLFFLIKTVAGAFISRSQFSFVYGVASRISNMKLLHYFEGAYTEYVETDSSVQIRKISHQPVEFAQYVLTGLQLIFTETVLILLVVAAILWYNAGLFLLLCLVLAPPVAFIAWFTRRSLRHTRKHVKQSAEKTLQYLQEALSAYEESNLYQKQFYFSGRYSAYQHSLNGYLASLQSIQLMPSRLMELFAVMGLFVLIVSSQWLGSSAGIINIGAFMAAAYKLIPGIIRILNLSGQVKTYAYTLNDIPHLHPSKHPATVSTAEAVTSIEFKNVSFRYKDKEILTDFNLELAKGEIAGFSALSGRGKTTIINLFLGFLEPQAGHIAINGKDQNATGRQQYWPDIAYVRQQAFLVHDTLLANITLGEEDHDTLKLQKALLLSGLKETLKHFPEGLQHLVRENGRNISGGQKQRIAMARAFYKDAGLLILDEPFNELDKASAMDIMQRLRTLAADGKMVIVITHDKDALALCHKVISLHD